MYFDEGRRKLLRESILLGVAGAAALPVPGEALPQEAKKQKENGGKEPEVTATEDLMREHGVIRRALLVYYEVVPKLRQNPTSVNAAALQQTAKLFRTFGEDYHEPCSRSSIFFR